LKGKLDWLRKIKFGFQFVSISTELTENTTSKANGSWVGDWACKTQVATLLLGCCFPAAKLLEKLAKLGKKTFQSKCSLKVFFKLNHEIAE
jgi:hypothetical protein